MLLCVCVTALAAPAPTTLPSNRLNPPIAVRSSPPRFSVATSVPLSLASGYEARVYVCEKPLHPPSEDPIRRGGELMAWGDGVGVAGRRTGRTKGPRGRGGPRARWGWIPRVGENGIPESLILLVNKCLGDSLLVHSYRPSFVSRRHCVLRFYLVFRSNGFWGPSRAASRVSLGLPLSPVSSLSFFLLCAWFAFLSPLLLMWRLFLTVFEYRFRQEFLLLFSCLDVINDL